MLNQKDITQGEPSDEGHHITQQHWSRIQKPADTLAHVTPECILMDNKCRGIRNRKCKVVVKSHCSNDVAMQQCVQRTLDATRRTTQPRQPLKRTFGSQRHHRWVKEI